MPEFTYNTQKIYRLRYNFATRHPVCLLLLIIGLAQAMLLIVTPVAGKEIVVLQSSKMSPYQLVAKGIRDELSGAIPIQVILLDQLNNDDFKRLNSKDNILFVAIGTPSALWLKRRLSGFVYCMVANPEVYRLDPEILGLGIEIPYPAQFNLMREAVQKTVNIGVLHRTDVVQSIDNFNAIHKALPVDMIISPVAINEEDSASDAVEKLLHKKVDFVFTYPDPSVFTSPVIQTLLLKALRYRTPVFGFSIPCVKAGALIGIAVNPYNHGKKTVSLINQFFRQKETPGQNGNEMQLPVVQTDYDIAINKIVARKLSIKIPQELITRSQFIFE